MYTGYSKYLLKGAFNMARKEEIEWLSGNEAALILTKNSGHEVRPNYVRILAAQNKIRSKKIDGRTRAYHGGDVKAYRVKRKDKRQATLEQQQSEDEQGPFAYAV